MNLPNAPKIYIAGPYSRPDPVVNVRAAIVVADELCAAGFVPFVPHLSHLWHLIAPKEYQTWLAYDLHWLSVCDAVIRLPGESPGADRECESARILGLPVFGTVAEVVEWHVLAKEIAHNAHR